MNTSAGTKLNDWGKIAKLLWIRNTYSSLGVKTQCCQNYSIITSVLQITPWQHYCEKREGGYIKGNMVTSQAKQIKQSLSAFPTVIMETLIRLHSEHWLYITLLLRCAPIDCNHSQPETFCLFTLSFILLISHAILQRCMKYELHEEGICHVSG